MHKGQERHERIGLRAATFLKRCGRDPETGQLLSLTGKVIDEMANPIHAKSIELFKKRQHKRHQWTPKLPRHHDQPENSWHANLEDEDADIVFEEFRSAVEASIPETRKWYEPPQSSNDNNNNDQDQEQEKQEEGVHDEVSPMSAVGFAEDETSPTRPKATILLQNDDEDGNQQQQQQQADDEEGDYYYSPSAQRPTSVITTAAGDNSLSRTRRKEAHKLLAAVSSSPGIANRNYNNNKNQQNNNQEYQQALELSDVYLAQDTTHHVSYRNLREDNKIHRIKTSQIIRGDGLDKITCGIPPQDRKQVRPGRVEVVLPGVNEGGTHRVVSRLVSHKQLMKEKLSHSVDFVARYEK